MELTDGFLEEKWNELEDVAFVEDEHLELVLNDDWFVFEKGCSREEIWHWFDTHYSKGVASFWDPRE